MKHTLLAATISVIFSFNSFSQVKQIELQAAGLTCSMCSKAVFKALIGVAFVKDVKADIKTSSYTIHLKDENLFDFDALKKAVEGAGFSVARLNANINFSNAKIENDTHVKFDGKTFHFMNVKSQSLNGEHTISLLDKNFVTAKEFKANNKFTTMKCYETGTMQSCCSNKTTGKIGERVYHVTLKS
jgi:copper chaperone CopZ